MKVRGLVECKAAHLEGSHKGGRRIGRWVQKLLQEAQLGYGSRPELQSVCQHVHVLLRKYLQQSPKFYTSLK